MFIIFYIVFLVLGSTYVVTNKQVDDSYRGGFILITVLIGVVCFLLSLL